MDRRFKTLLVLWIVFIGSASLWLPGYEEGDIDGLGPVLVPIFAVIAGLTVIGVRKRAPSLEAALLSALPVIALLVVAAAVGDQRNEDLAQFRGGPLFLYFAVGLWVSWGAFVLSTALVSRTKWSGFAGIGVSVVVAVLGFLLFTMRID